eukprot:Phypoly_transcript_02947.p2 GENE.Phypoly_transcript_02947~~Phypoly_transcript_02947.p2  ORF type:complete len:334 (+),score=71.36 Phypoly_transcript_02947:1560-2561(+)
MQYNVNNPAVKRILREVKEMEAEPSDQYHANPLEDNIFEWHFTIRGPKDTEFEGGLYHGRIILPPEYPFKPPNIVLLNESGRFEVGTKICLSISSYHPEHWQPSWTIKTMLVALISFLPSKGDGAIGAIDMPAKDRKDLALKTPSFFCNKCGKRMCDILAPVEVGAKTEATPTEEPANTTTTTTTTTSSTESTSQNDTPTSFATPDIPTPDSTSASPTFAPISTTPAPLANTSNNLQPEISTNPQPPAPSTSIPAPISHTQPAIQPTPQPQPVQHVTPQPATTPLPQQYIINQHATVANVNVNNSSDTTNLDYFIIALVIAIMGLLAKKFYGL